MVGSFTVEVRGKTQYLSHGITIPVKYPLEAGSIDSSQPGNTNMFGLAPVIFYSIIRLVIAGIAGSGLFLGRNSLLQLK